MADQIRCACVSNDARECIRRRYHRPFWDDLDDGHDTDECECACHDEYDEDEDHG